MKTIVLTVEFWYRGRKLWVVQAQYKSQYESHNSLGVIFSNEPEARAHHGQLSLIASMPPHLSDDHWEHLTDPTGFTWVKAPAIEPDDMESDDGTA